MPPALATSIYPWLPFELVEVVLAHVWFAPLTIVERMALMTSVPLVSRMWLQIYSAIAHRHVYVACPAHLDKLLTRLVNGHAYLQCQSISLLVDAAEFRRGQRRTSLINLLYLLQTGTPLLNLRTLSLLYLNAHQDDVLLELADVLEFCPCPPQVTNLELSLDAGPWTMSTLCCRPNSLIIRSLPSICHLTIKGATESAVADIVAACPNLTTLRLHSDSCFESVCNCKGRFMFHEGTANFPRTHVSIKLHSLEPESRYWDGVQVGRAQGLAVFQRCATAEDDVPLTFAAS